MEGHGLSIDEAAEALGVRRQHLSAVFDAGVSFAPELALRFEEAFGRSMDALTRMQDSHAVTKARARESEIAVHRCVPKRTPADLP